MLARRCLRWFFTACLLVPTLAFSEPKPLTDQEITELANKVDKADKLFKANKCSEALPIYQEAYQRTEEPVMLFSMAQCFRNLDRPKEAADAYRGFLKAAPPNSDLRPVAERLLPEMEAKIKPEEKPAPEPKAKGSLAPALFVGAGGVAGLGAISGIVAVSSALKASAIEDDPNGDFSQIAVLFGRARATSIAADALFVTVVGLGVAGVISWKTHKSQEVSLHLGPSNAALCIRF